MVFPLQNHIGYLRVRMKRRALILILIFLAAAGVGLAAWNQWMKNTLVVHNTSQQAIEEITISVCRRDYVLRNIEVGDSKNVDFVVDGDSGFVIAGTLADGQEIEGSFGYVTGGSAAHHNNVRVEVADTAVTGSQEHY